MRISSKFNRHYVSGPAQQGRFFYLKADIDAPDDLLRSLRDTNPREAVARLSTITRLASELAEKRVSDVRPLAQQGTFHLIHEVAFSDGGRAIFRSSLPDILPNDQAFVIERAVTKSLSHANLPFISIWAEGRNSSFAYQLMDFATGANLAALDREALERDFTLIGRMGQAVAALRRVSGSGFGPLISLEEGLLRGTFATWEDYAFCHLEDHLQRGEALGLWERSETEKISARCQAIRPLLPENEQSLLHADLGNHNIFIEDAVVRFIDWEDAMLGDSGFDAAMWASFHTPAAFSIFLDAFRPGWCNDLTFRAGFGFYLFRIVLAKAIHRHRFGYPDHPGRPNMRQRLNEANEIFARGAAGETGALVVVA